MAGMRDPITEEPPPSRFDPDELNSFEPTEALDFTPPSIVWASSVRAQLQADRLRTQLVILALSKVGIHLIHNMSKKAVIGRILLPGDSVVQDPSLEGKIVEPSLLDRTCTLYSCDPELSVVLVSVQYQVSPEVSNIWAKVLFQAVQAERILVLEQVPVQHFRGKLSVDEPMMFVLNTDDQKLEDKQLEPVAPYYPSGSLVDGLAAALLTHCQIRGIKARLLLTWPSDDVGLTRMLVATLSNLLKSFKQGGNVSFVEAGMKLTAKKARIRSHLYI